MVGFSKLTQSLFGSSFVGVFIYKSFHEKKCYARVIQDENTPKNLWNYNWDGRKDENNKGKRILLFLRHGQYEYQNTDEACKLTEKGREQAKILGSYLASFSKNLNLPITKIVSSDMTRAKETCNIALKEILDDVPPVEFTSLLREGPPHSFDPPHVSYDPDPIDIEKNGKRMDEGFNRYVHRSEDTNTTLEIYFCHANVIRYFVCKVLQLPLNCWLRFSLKHCSVTQIVIRPDGKVSCYGFGDAGFMPPDMITFS